MPSHSRTPAPNCQGRRSDRPRRSPRGSNVNREASERRSAPRARDTHTNRLAQNELITSYTASQSKSRRVGTTSSRSQGPQDQATWGALRATIAESIRAPRDTQAQAKEKPERSRERARNRTDIKQPPTHVGANRQQRVKHLSDRPAGSVVRCPSLSCNRGPVNRFLRRLTWKRSPGLRPCPTTRHVPSHTPSQKASQRQACKSRSVERCVSRFPS